MQGANLNKGTHPQHPHLLGLSTQAGYSCDLCRRSDAKRYRCTEGCDFDVCGDCWSKATILPEGYNANIPTKGKHSAHAHELEKTERMGYSCDVCRQKDDRRYRCASGCDFDVCGKCWDKGPIVQTTPPPATPEPTIETPNRAKHTSHAHELEKSDNLGYSCDVCRGKDNRRYHCTERCNYDVCGKCWDKGVIIPQPASSTPTVATPNNLAIAKGLHPSHTHELEKTDRPGYSCDVCRQKDDRRYHCSTGCNYDVCGKCWDKVTIVVPSSATTPNTAVVTTSTETRAKHNSHAHELEKTDRQGYSCDVCRSKDERRYHCTAGCDYDVCGKCWDKGVIPPTPPASTAAAPAASVLTRAKHNSHAHELEKSDKPGYSCDVCRSRDDRRYHCTAGCDYDVCGKCWDKDVVPPTPQAPASAGSGPSANASIKKAKHPAHAHDLETHTSLGYSCDVCGSKDDRRYHCSTGCNYDVCGKCWDKASLVVPPVIAIPAPPAPAPAPVQAPAPAISRAPAPVAVAASLPEQVTGEMHYSHDHPLAPPDIRGAYQCDVCRGRDIRRYRCTQGCDYDVCGACWDKKAPSPLSAPTVPTAFTPSEPSDPSAPAPPPPMSSASPALLAPAPSASAKLHTLEQVLMMTLSGRPLDAEAKALLDAQPPGQKRHYHALVLWDKPGGWSCDVCRRDGKGLLKHFHCGRGCNYDQCQKCFTGEENEMKNYSEDVLIRPGPEADTGLPLRDLFDETKTNFWSEFRAPYASGNVGKIVFSTQPIDRFMQGAELKEKFNIEAGDEIHARAFWPRALRNYAIAHKKGDPKSPVYGPEFILTDSYGHMGLHALQIFQYVSIDGVPVTREINWNNCKVDDALAFCTEVGPKPPGSSQGSRNEDAMRKYGSTFSPTTTDFWAMNQSMTFALNKAEPSMSNEWFQGIPSFMKRVSTLAAGEHKVTVDLRFRIVSRVADCQSWRDQNLLPASETFPYVQATPVSFPICQGEFTIVLPEGGAKALDPLPKRKTQINTAEADRLEALIADYMRRSGEWGSRREKTERILKVAITADGWSKLQKNHDCTFRCRDPCPKWDSEPWRYGLDFTCVCYRSPLDGWKEEMPCAAFRLACYAYSPNPQTVNDIIGIGVVMGGSFDIDVDNVPDYAFEAAGLKRCPVSLRRGFSATGSS